ncbi:hypothetical protein P4S64_13870 [Vibrio sp. M60_M31a]
MPERAVYELGLAYTVPIVGIAGSDWLVYVTGVTESPDFEQAKAKEAQQSESASVPIVELFRSSSKEIGLGTLSGIAPLFIQSY